MISYQKLDSSNISQYSHRIKSTTDNTSNNSKIKSINEIKKSNIPTIKPSKRLVYFMRNKENDKENISTNKKNNKTEISSKKKGFSIKKINTAKKVSKNLIRNKTEDKIEYNSIKKKLTALNKTPTPPKKIRKTIKKPSTLLISERNKKDKNYNNNNNNNSKKNYLQNSFYLNKKSNNLLQDDILTIQNTRRNTIITKRETIATNNKNKKEKKQKKLSFDFSKSKHNLSLTNIKINNKYYSPTVKLLKNMIKKESLADAEPLNEDKNDMKIKKSLTIKERDINNDKLEIINKLSKNKLVFKDMFYGNKRNTIRDIRYKIISISKNEDKKDKTQILNSIKLKEIVQNSFSNHKKMEDFKKLNKSFLKKIIFTEGERNSTCDRTKNKKKSNIDNNYLKTDNNNIYMKKLSQNINKTNNHNYLKETICSVNKMNNKKKEINTHSTEHKKSKTIEKNINSIKNKNKNKYAILHRNTMTKLKLNEKYNNKINITSNSNYSTSNTSRTSLRKIDEYIMIRELGKGSYASVKLAINKINNNKCAIKIYSKKALLDPQKKNVVNNELKLLKQIDNINIVKLYEVIETSSYLYLVMEYIEGISLLDTIRRDENHYLEEQRALKIFIQIIKAIMYCQSKNICHRDIKLENILITKDDIVKIIDFGFAVKTDKETYQNLFCGSPSYMAPEIVNKEKYIAQYSDIWSLGVLFYSMLYGRFPFKANAQEDLFKVINDAKVEFPEDIEVNDKIKKLLKKIFVVVPTQRPSLQEILNDILLLIN